MSLTDGRAKMSKSAELDNSRINLNDDPATIARKIKKCKSDEFTGLEWDNPERPEATNLLNIYQAVTGMERGADPAAGASEALLVDALPEHDEERPGHVPWSGGAVPEQRVQDQVRQERIAEALDDGLVKFGLGPFREEFDVLFQLG